MRGKTVMKVELIYEQSCPNIAAARTQLLKAFHAAKLTPRWQEWELNQAETPAYAHGCGSPTILVNGRDVSGGTMLDNSDCCRIYSDPDGHYSGVPVLSDIVSALREATDTNADEALSESAIPFSEG
jgi:hypothetical protein